MIPTKDLLKALALRLTGRPIAILNSKVLAIVTGGAVIGLYGKDAHEIPRETGHCLYITPGRIATQERRIKYMFETFISSGLGKVERCTDLNNVEKPSDGFAEGEFGYIVHLYGDSAAVTAVINCGTKILHIDILKAIVIASSIQRWQDCLGDCVRGRLAADDLNKVRVVDKINYGDCSTQ